MTTRSFLSCALAGMLLAASSQLTAHHSDSVYFVDDRGDPRGAVKIEGTVSQVRLINPHAEFFVDVMNEDGEVDRWAIESDSWNQLRSFGWNEATIEVGDRIEVIVSMSRFHNTAGRLRDILVHGSGPDESSQLFLEFIPSSESGQWESVLELVQDAPQCEGTVPYDHLGERGEEILVCLALDEQTLETAREEFANRIRIFN
ncbi:DUF6152 family protein [Candidatus Rariloculus sp.]|uniref:DUF6152 family protein n=1 Tax=Candidatus Rariloculus sp. TaxID=3101265 RepID=UPI003D11EFA4